MARVPSAANEEPLVVVKTGVDIVREIIGEDRGDSRDGVIGEGKTSLCCGGYGSVGEGTSGAKDRDVSRYRGISSHRGPEMFLSRSGDEDIVRVDGDIFVERGEEEGVEDFLGYMGGKWEA